MSEFEQQLPELRPLQKTMLFGYGPNRFSIESDPESVYTTLRYYTPADRSDAIVELFSKLALSKSMSRSAYYGKNVVPVLIADGLGSKSIVEIDTTSTNVVDDLRLMFPENPREAVLAAAADCIRQGVLYGVMVDFDAVDPFYSVPVKVIPVRQDIESNNRTKKTRVPLGGYSLLRRLLHKVVSI